MNGTNKAANAPAVASEFPRSPKFTAKETTMSQLYADAVANRRGGADAVRGADAKLRANGNRNANTDASRCPAGRS